MSEQAMDQLVEFEGYFRSEEFVSNALGLRHALAELGGDMPLDPHEALELELRERIRELERVLRRCESLAGSICNGEAWAAVHLDAKLIINECKAALVELKP